MRFAVIHIKKGTAGKAGGLGSHIDRSKHVPNVNPELSQYNARIDIGLSNSQMALWTKDKNTDSLQTRINNRIKEGYTGKTAIRKDAVTHLNVVMSGSHEDMIRITNDKKMVECANDNFKFACDRFGKENIVEFAIHVDERTPHIHCIVVPLNSDRRLSAKEVMGNRTKMTELQEKYGRAMKSYDLERGIKGSKATHDTIQEYYARINQRINPEPHRKIEITITIAIQDIPKIEKPLLIGREKWKQEQNEIILSKVKSLGGDMYEINKRAENSLKIKSYRHRRRKAG